MMLRTIERQFLQKAGCQPKRVRAEMPGSPEIADQLVQLYLGGHKTAGSSLILDYETSGDPLPQIDDHWIVLDSTRTPRLLLKTVRVESYLFKDVPASVAQAEGEGDLSLSYWRKAHREFFAPFLDTLGIPDLEEAEVIVEYFERIY